MRILVIEDEHKLANAIKRGLEIQSYAVDVSYDGEDGLDMIFSGEEYDLIISDVMLPGIDGFEICEEVRKEKIHTPILLLTAKGEIEDRVNGLDSGADDYMVKPFSFEELFARVRALIRRNDENKTLVLRVSDLSLDTISFKVYRNKKEIKLSSREFSILEYLMRNEGKVLSKDQIINHVWDYDADVLPGTVEVHMKNLRDKIDKPFNKKLVKTMRGFGYEINSD